MIANEFSIGTRKVGAKHPPLIIAEIGINHGGSLDTALMIANHAIAVGAEVIKHQTHIVEDEMSPEARKIIPGNANISIFEIMSSCALSEEDERALAKFVTDRGAIFLSTPFSRAAVDRLESMNVPAYKIGSGECNNYPLVEYIASKRKPIILSTGMNSIESIRTSVEIITKWGNSVALLHCTNIYPTPNHLVRLEAMLELSRAFPGVVFGLSDHSMTNYPSLGAVALGASIIERHFTDSKSREGPDICCSMDPEELSELLTGSNIIYQARFGKKSHVEEEFPTIRFAFASVVSIKPIVKGETFSLENLWVRRPGTGDFLAKDFYNILGKRASKDIPEPRLISFDDIIE